MSADLPDFLSHTCYVLLTKFISGLHAPTLLVFFERLLQRLGTLSSLLCSGDTVLDSFRVLVKDLLSANGAQTLFTPHVTESGEEWPNDPADPELAKTTFQMSDS